MHFLKPLFSNAFPVQCLECCVWVYTPIWYLFKSRSRSVDDHFPMDLKKHLNILEVSLQRERMNQVLNTSLHLFSRSFSSFHA